MFVLLRIDGNESLKMSFGNRSWSSGSKSVLLPGKNVNVWEHRIKVEGWEMKMRRRKAKIKKMKRKKSQR